VLFWIPYFEGIGIYYILLTVAPESYLEKQDIKEDKPVKNHRTNEVIFAHFLMHGFGYRASQYF
ncbi:hypothetical protein ACJX0J_039041, partial [Zea mays]